jgi:hypothetical protein
MPSAARLLRPRPWRPAHFTGDASRRASPAASEPTPPTLAYRAICCSSAQMSRGRSGSPARTADAATEQHV